LSWKTSDKGDGVPVRIIIEMLKHGYSPKEIHEEYPSVPPHVIRIINEKIKNKEKLLAEVKVF